MSWRDALALARQRIGARREQRDALAEARREVDHQRSRRAAVETNARRGRASVDDVAAARADVADAERALAELEAAADRTAAPPATPRSTLVTPTPAAQADAWASVRADVARRLRPHLGAPVGSRDRAAGQLAHAYCRELEDAGLSPETAGQLVEHGRKHGTGEALTPLEFLARHEAEGAAQLARLRSTEPADPPSAAFEEVDAAGVARATVKAAGDYIERAGLIR